jgi:hypothetical protein
MRLLDIWRGLSLTERLMLVQIAFQIVALLMQ